MTGSPPKRIFISYSHKDETHRERLETHLALPQRQKHVAVWHDRKLLPGEEWAGKIDEELERADVVLLLVSADFLASDYCYDVEMTRALKRHESGEARVVPIIVESCDWRPAPFGKLNALPKDGKPVVRWRPRAEAWTDVALGIRRVLDGEPADPVAAGLTSYLRYVRDDNYYLKLRGLPLGLPEQMELERVYTRLRVAGSAGGNGRATTVAERSPAESGRDLELREVVANHADAVLIGDPGSGKTTFLRFVAQNLARLGLDPADDEAGNNLGRADGDTPFPILLRLADFAGFLDAGPKPQRSVHAPRHFYRFLDSLIADYPSWNLPATYLSDRVQKGGCFLLLDGLDEVPNEQRDRVAGIIEKVVVTGRRSNNRHLVTCRTRAYEERAPLAQGISSFRLAPFGDDQIKDFVGAWCRALPRSAFEGKHKPPSPEAYAKELLDAIDGHKNIGPLTESPLMLTMVAVLHWNDRELPEARADLYAAAVRYLLKKNAHLVPYRVEQRRMCLETIALRMMEDRKGMRRTLGRSTTADIAAPVLEVTRPRALEFLHGEELNSGILVSRTVGQVEFWHLSFQEYLAAVALSWDFDDSNGGYYKRVSKHLFQASWNEVILLLAGSLWRNHGIEAPQDFIRRIIGRRKGTVSRARAVGLVGRILRDIEPLRDPEREPEGPEHGTGYAEALEATLAIFEPGGEAIGEKLRVEVGEALGQAVDPRLVDAAANRVPIEGGTFWMGAQKQDREKPCYDKEAEDGESPVHRVTVSDFLLGRFPVTVQEYEAFLEAGDRGYFDENNWTADGWAWRKRESREAPDGWKQQLRYPNRPVTQVTWYEANAYCRWAGGRLPTEAQWEYAARGREGRKYPWGADAPSERHASFSNRVDHATPAGIYPQGPTADGIHDMAGNVWEWCADFHGKYTSEDCKDPTGPASGSARVLRGGAFYYVPRSLRASFRYSDVPGLGYVSYGFRVAWSPPAGP